MSIERLEVKIPTQAEIHFKISAPRACPSQVEQMLVGSEVVDEKAGHPLSYAEAKRNEVIPMAT